MSKFFYSRLALGNIKKNSKSYVPYMLTCIMTVMMFYIMRSLSLNPGISEIIGENTLSLILGFGSGVVGIFSVIFLFYTNSFLMKQRTHEFGVYNVLGMEKKHIAAVVAMETAYTAVISIIFGIGFGIALDKLMFLGISKLIGVKTPLGFFISGDVISYTAIFFLLLFFVITVKSVLVIQVSNPIELLRAANKGEREPKTRWIMTILGVIGLGLGYYIAITTKNPIASIYAFFVAVILVIISTYLLFIAGSVALLKLLKKKKKYYYKTKHFISVSGMIYRMKQNAVGLANICILSTMVLVMVSVTSSLMIGFEDIMSTRFSNDFAIDSRSDDIIHNNDIAGSIENVIEETDFSIREKVSYYYLAVNMVRRGNEFVYGEMKDMSELDNMNIIEFCTLDDYNRIMGRDLTLDKDEVLIYSNRSGYAEDTIKIFDREYKVKEVLSDAYINGVIASNIADTHFVIVNDMDELRHMDSCAASAQGEPEKSSIHYYYGFDTDSDENVQNEFHSKLSDRLSEYDVNFEYKSGSRRNMLALYGGFFFLGTFLGVLFVMATVLIIYYKQISEGYEDRLRFDIMQKVGLSKTEVKSAIRSQVITVFFLPLIVAGVHLCAAFPILARLLATLNMTNVSLYIVCAVASFAVFALMYIIIYSMTAKVYYKIVSSK